MKRLLSALSLALICAAPAFAADAASAAASGAGVHAQRNKMGECNKEAGDKKGDERKAFMKECLSAEKKAVADKRKAQQEKMKACNADAKTKALQGDARKTFMKECLSGAN